MVGTFGANASGKSNCLHALAFMRRLVIFSDREVEPGLGVPREPYRMTPDSLDASSHYVVDIDLEGVRHTYGFTLDNDGVLNEWLCHYPLRRKRRVFERTGDSYAWGEESSQRTMLERIAEVTAPTALFLSTVSRFDNRQAGPDEAGPEPLRDTYRWFQKMSSRHQPHSVNRVPLNGSGWPESGGEQKHPDRTAAGSRCRDRRRCRGNDHGDRRSGVSVRDEQSQQGRKGGNVEKRT
ncbi:AAA family ATPase [Micromonospora sp. NPDC000207]|uniref:AAA family ATPase n=1 Tax=Micromonospora sp. NPDC000207 TaxID=3154246 RepID=UPI00331B113B